MLLLAMSSTYTSKVIELESVNFKNKEWYAIACLKPYKNRKLESLAYHWLLACLRSNEICVGDILGLSLCVSYLMDA